MKKLLSFLLALTLCLTLISPGAASSATVKINKAKLSLNVGKTYTLKLTGTTKAAKWSSSDKTVASVSSKGKVTAVSKGTATITATVNKKPYQCKVTVKDPEVEIIFTYMNFSNLPEEDYLTSVKAANPDFISVKKYDKDHYIARMHESTRREMLAPFDDIDKQIAAFLSDSDYGKVYKDVKYNDTLSEVTIYAVKANFDALSSLTTLLQFAYLSDTYQALNYVDIKDRYLDVQFLDVDTKEVLYHYNSKDVQQP